MRPPTYGNFRVMSAWRQSRVALTILAASGALAGGCTHPWPFDAGKPEQVGPRGQEVPRRLTFNPGDDRDPSVRRGSITYSRLDPDERGEERCLATIPVDGGTILAETCPGPPRTPADTLIDTWVQPSLSADGLEVAYLWQEGSLLGVLGFESTSIVVAPASQPDSSTLRWPIVWTAPSGRIADAVSAISWADDRTLRFLIGYEFIFKVKGGGQIRYTDTTFESFALAQLDARTGAFSIVPGGQDVLAYAPAPDGGLWLVKHGAPATLLHQAPGADTANVVGAFADSVTVLANVGDLPVAITAASDSTVVWLVPGDSLPHSLVVGSGVGPVTGIAPVPGTRRFIAVVERGRDLFGDPANLWLYDLP
ncbi:MAG TPA: hypothetical protein VFP39_17780 [Gemmatimonadales bacterium]|nr:hypothetical protein [Gemmatimonadales bacterium]